MLQRRPSLSWTKKCAFAVLTTGVFFAVLESVLALAGVCPWYVVHDPHVGFQPGAPLFVPDGDRRHTSPAKLAYFNEQSFPLKKGPRTYRIFCLGGSTTFGHPYDHRTSFSGWLHQRLCNAAPDRDWEVINCGGISYASYRVALLMRELAEYEPDLFIIYTGHNEFLEKRTYGDDLRRDDLRRRLESLASKTRTATLFASLAHVQTSSSTTPGALLHAEVDTILDNSVGPADYHRDEAWRDDVVRHFQLSLERMCGLARSVGARVIFVTPAGNARDFSPFKSEHGKIGAVEQRQWDTLMSEAREARASGDLGTAVTRYLAAAEVDPFEAQGLFEAGGALWADGRRREAADFFRRAVDEDVCPLRATSAIRAVVRTVAARQNVPLIDFPRLLAEAQGMDAAIDVLGDESFLDHVHPTIEGHRHLAWALYEQLAAWNVAPRQADDAKVRQQVSQRVLTDLDSRAHALALVQVIQVLSWAGKNDEALKLTQRAEEVHAGLSEVASYRGRLLEKAGRDDEAFAAYQEAIRRNPNDSLALSRAGWSALRQKKFVDARTFFATAVVRMPPQVPNAFRASTRFGLGLAFYHLEQWSEAKLEFEATQRIAPDNDEVQQYLDEATRRARTK